MKYTNAFITNELNAKSSSKMLTHRSLRQAQRPS